MPLRDKNKDRILNRLRMMNIAAEQGIDIGMIEAGTIDPDRRRVLKNMDGSISTERSFSIGTDKGEAVIPQIVGGKLVSEDEAINHYRETGEHLGIFATPEQATNFAHRFHERQEKFYKNRKK